MEEKVNAVFEGLNEEQRNAVSCTEGPVLIVAGAGSGKTRVLTSRIALLLANEVDPARILALTFTKKAAGEMKERIAAMVGDRRARRLVMGTFHAVFVRFLREYAGFLGYPERFVIYDTADSQSAMKACIKELQLDDKVYKPIRKGDTVWTISLLGLAAIGKLFTKGRYDVRRKVAVCGPMAIEPSYVETLPGMPMKELAGFYGSNAAEVRFVSGNVLSGSNEGVDGYLGYFSNQVTLLREGTERELLGWLRPLRWKQFSTDHSYFSWLMPKRKYDMDTNLHGGPRAFLMNDGYYAKVLPMDIYPIYLTKACLAGEIEKMEQFGIYEVLPEDLAVCEFVDPSKNNIQEIIEKGIDLMIKEMA